MGLVYDVYKLCNGILFVSMSELEFYKSINLMDLLSHLKIEDLAIKRAYYVLHNFTNCIKSKEVKNYWIHVILQRLGKDYEDNYLKRYKSIVNKDATTDDKLFAGIVDKIFKPYLIK